MIKKIMRKFQALRKSSFDSYICEGICEGCRRCLRGRKMVLFVTGKCSRNCSYCSLSKKRKNIDKVWANEKLCKIGDLKEVFKEIENSGAKGCGITGGDPLLKFERTLKYAEALKKKFKEFHIHIYLPTKLITKDKLRKLSKVIDEVRFHPDIESNWQEEKRKIKLAQEFFKKKNIGIEIPVFPDKENLLKRFLKNLAKEVGFINLNELEIGESNKDFFLKKYKIKEGGYVIAGSIESGKRIMRFLHKIYPRLKIHLCSAKTKNWHQFKNRLKNYKILAFGKHSSEGTVIYFTTKIKNKKDILNVEKAFGKNNCLYDAEKKRMILNPAKVKRNLDKFKILKIEEYPTSDREEIEVEEI